MEHRLKITSHEQFAAMVEFMERHGDLGRPHQGLQGRLRVDRLWQEIGTLLNSVGGGVKKPLDKWKKVWADWKTKTKKKYFIMRRETVVSGGNRRSLTSLEKRLLTLMGLSIVPRLAGVPDDSCETGASLDSECGTRETPPDTAETNHIVEMFVVPLTEQDIMSHSLNPGSQEENTLQLSLATQRSQLELFNTANHYEEAYCPKIAVLDMNGTARFDHNNYNTCETNDKVEIDVNRLQCKQEVDSTHEEESAVPQESNAQSPHNDEPTPDQEHTKTFPTPRLSYDTRRIRKRAKLTDDRITTKRLEILEIQKKHEQIKLDKGIVLLDAEIELKRLLIENAKLDIELKKNML